MRTEPTARADGRCALPACRKRRGTKLPKSGVVTKRALEMLKVNLARDPFCSAACARKYYAVDIAEDARAAQQQRDYDHDAELLETVG